MTNPYNEALGATLIERSKRETIVLVGVTLAHHTDAETEASLDELALLIDTAGADEAARLMQRRDTPDHTWFIGKGKAEELRDLCLAVDADTVVFDNELSPGQQYNLEKLLGRTALDRTAVILDIFAQNAHTLEGKAQVELALLRYRLPRLRRGAKANLSQQRGGVGMVRRIRILDAEAQYSVLSDRGVIPPWGILGGAAGQPYHLSIEREGETLGFDTPGTKSWETHPMWDKDPVMKPYAVAGKLGATPGRAGPPNAKAAEVLSKYLIVNMFASAIKGQSAEDAVKAAETELKKIYV